ncbi:hypothetical protein NCCP691_41430 [Noviherbaspirillum aridicola]|uniref:Uncharacterized protein n=1 Tax=Noviherbaspirillum aridicola TaxID=2849687 RepID=A0ABQ4QAN0_9BURK|nr:hypothetical protein NCCP691_41430 [Noviherbaspirillum aridicola]
MAVHELLLVIETPAVESKGRCPREIVGKAASVVRSPDNKAILPKSFKQPSEYRVVHSSVRPESYYGVVSDSSRGG